jgi:hypothetical protein
LLLDGGFPPRPFGGSDGIPRGLPLARTGTGSREPRLGSETWVQRERAQSGTAGVSPSLEQNRCPLLGNGHPRVHADHLVSWQRLTAANQAAKSRVRMFSRTRRKAASCARQANLRHYRRSGRASATSSLKYVGSVPSRSSARSTRQDQPSGAGDSTATTRCMCDDPLHGGEPPLWACGLACCQELRSWPKLWMAFTASQPRH